MPEMIHFPTDPSDPVEVLDIQSPEDLSAFFCDRFEAVHGQGWTAYTCDDQASAPNPRAAAFLVAHAANGRTDWSTSLRGPVLAAFRPALTAAPLPSTSAPWTGAAPAPRHPHRRRQPQLQPALGDTSPPCPQLYGLPIGLPRDDDRMRTFLTAASTSEPVASTPAADPANFWLGLIAAAGIFALANFPAWDRIVEAGKIDKEKGSMARLLFLTFGILAPFALLVRSLGALGENPVRTPGELEKVVLLLVFGAVIVVRASISQAPAAEATTNPTATVAAQDPAPQSKRTRVTMRDTALAGLVVGAFIRERLRR